MDHLTVAESRVRDAFADGTRVEFGDDDPAEGASWGPERTVRAKVLRELLLGCVSNTAALQVAGARITGEFDLRNATIPA